MNLLRKLLAKFRPYQPPLVSNTQLKELARAVQAPVVVAEIKPKGRIIKRTRRPEFDPRTGRRGGRIIKVMPRQLQKIKEAQEKVEDDIGF
jgi:hypothetical protein